MHSITKSLKSKLKQGKMIGGAWMMTVNPAYAELASVIGLDFVVIDMEHGAIGLADLPGILRGFSRETSAIVRVPSADPSLIARVLDRGAHGVMVPRVESVETAIEVSRAAKFPPQGDRGLALPALRASGYGTNPDYRRNANADTLLIIQLESANAMNLALDIGGLPEVDLVFVGPTDLSANMNLEGQEYFSALNEINDGVVAKCKVDKIPVGIIPFAGRAIPDLKQLGFQMIVAGSDVAFLRDSIINLKNTFESN
jgi:2-keto-3-deoxy-L-rhamnonate aldolase RhmA